MVNANNEFVRLLIRWAFNLKATLFGLACAFAGAALIVAAAFRSTTSETYAILLQVSTDGNNKLTPKEAVELINQVATGQWPEQAMFSLGTTLVSLGTIAIAWDIWLHTTWVALVRDEIIGAITRSSTAKRLRKNYRAKILREILEDEHGSEVGQAMFRESLSISKSTQAMRSDFIYNIRLSPLNSEFHRARFLLEFTISRLPRKLRVLFSHVRDSLDFHARYQQVTNRCPDAIYRYVLHSTTAPGRDCFIIEKAWVSYDGNQTELYPEVGRTDDEGTEFLLKATTSTGEKTIYRQSVSPVTIHLEISTVVDARRNEFPIWLAYPVKDFRSRMDASGIGVTEVDVLEFFTSAQRFRREDLTGDCGEPESAGLVTASGRLEDLILPNSGLTYIWR